MFIRRIVLVLAFALASLGAAAPQSQSVPPDDAVVAAGEVVIHVDGLTGGWLDVPAGAEFDEKAVEIDFGDAEYVFVGLHPVGQCEGNELCISASADGFAGFEGTTLLGREFLPFTGMHRVFAASLEPVTVTLRFTGLSGQVELTPVEPIDAHLERLEPRTCLPAPGCQTLSAGGATREVTAPALAHAAAYAEWPRSLTDPYSGDPTNRGWVTSCAYPNITTTDDITTDPDDYPLGCSYTDPRQPDTINKINNSVRSPSMITLAAGKQGAFVSNWAADGPAYIGYNAHRQGARSLMDGTSYGYGLWIEG